MMFAVNNSNCVCFVGDKLDGMTMDDVEEHGSEEKIAG
jgi:hypothetical protein